MTVNSGVGAMGVSGSPSGPVGGGVVIVAGDPRGGGRVGVLNDLTAGMSAELLRLWEGVAVCL